MELVTAVARNKRKTAVVVAYGVVTATVVGLRWLHYAPTAPTVWVPLARASAAGVYLNFALVLVPMMRLLLSHGSFGPLRVVLPFHKAVEAHTIAGVAILGFSAIHVGAYVGLAVTHRALFGALATAGVVTTGLVLTVLLALLGWGARMRTTGRFEAFYFTHFLTVPIGLVAAAHAPWFVAIVALPLGLYLVDRLVRIGWMARGARIEHLAVDGRDLDLVVRRPSGFSYRSGDYAFLCVPAISRVQWHPFSLVNAPSDTGSLAFRIRRCGAWTDALAAVPPGTPVYVDGPFGSPCRDLHGCRRAVVVAAGIGITPFVSFLEEIRTTTATFERLHVYWLERDEASFSRFLPLLDTLERQLGGRLVVTLVTRAPSATPARLVCSRTIDWDAELTALRKDGLDGGTLFFCGPKPLSDTLRSASRRAGLVFRTESF